jgi:glutamate racemase
VGPQVQLLETGPAIARQTLKRLEEAGLADRSRLQGEGAVDLISTGPMEALEAAAQRWVGGRLATRVLALP